MEAALEWVEYRSLLCSGCGQPKYESMNPEMAHAYEAVPLTCYGCATNDAERRTVVQTKSGGSLADSAFDGLYIVVQKSEGLNSG